MDQNDDPLLKHLERLTELVESRFDALEKRLRALEKDAGEIREMLATLKNNLDCAVDELVEAEDQEDEDDDDAEEVWYLIH